MADLKFEALEAEYGRLWAAMQIRPERQPVVDQIARKSIANKLKYESVAAKTGVPWQWIACAHSLESSQNFTRHLHNGDPLTARTVQVPRGRPASGSPPFTWEASAIDALTMPPHSLHEVKNWSIERMLYELERYNGWGYRKYHPKTLSPYLWSYTNNYKSGKYVADGQWSDSAVSEQCGAAAILYVLLDHSAVVSKPPVPQGPKHEVLYPGSRSPDVPRLKQGLAALMMAEEGYGEFTVQIVRALQAQHGLKVDGVVGNTQTWPIIDEALK